ncbi:MAG: FAD binding domain-containing protein [Burkholderiaceae bacterium]
MYEFEYLKPASTGDARKASTEDTRYLAGGQSLVQSMRLRLASATTLIDLAGIQNLSDISVDEKSVKIGAMASHASVGLSEAVRQAIPALAELAGGIGDPMVRNMGTLGGALANADPAACYPAAVLGLGATIHTDQRTLDGDDFFHGLYETALEPGELITAVSFARADQAAYVKFKQPASRFALVGVMVSQSGGQARVGVTGAKTSAFRWADAEAALSKSFTPDAVDSLEISSADMNADLHATAEYRAAMVKVMTRRAVAAALGQ